MSVSLSRGYSDSSGAKALRLLMRDPRQLFSILWAKLSVVVLPTPRRVVRRRINGIVYEFDFTNEHLLRDFYQFGRPAIKSMFYGGYEPLTIRAMRRFLKRGDCFLDVGANTGYLSAIGAGLVGKSGQVHSFEPVPRYFARVERLRELNPEHTLIANACAVGAEDGTATIQIHSRNAGGSTLVPEELPDELRETTLAVPVRRLDAYIAEKNLGRVAVIKIDVEGFEYAVLQGLTGYLERVSQRPTIICEVNPDSIRHLGGTPADLGEYLRRFGYRAFPLHDLGEEIDITRLEGLMNLCFVPSPA